MAGLPEAARLGKTLEVAWRPFAVGWKKLWWECVAIPEDVNEVEFRQGKVRQSAKPSHPTGSTLAVFRLVPTM